MARWLATVCIAGWFVAAGCAPAPVCGEDQVGEPIPVCLADLPGEPEPLEFCPGDHWSNADCASCSCDDGRIRCGEPDPECAPAE